LAIVQISRITNRKGLQENLPQLAGAELGWSIDERRLFIGNGTLEEGAPIIGNTEILTEFTDIFAFQTNYTYKGDAATGYTVQTGPTPSTPITQSLQNWLDQFATIKDFGAVGNGVADDTDAINRALYELYCREVNPEIRRSLFFPAGIYRVTSTIKIPPYATLYGEGIDNSIIRMDNSTEDSTLVEYVARTADSLQQIGPDIGTNGAITPQYITIENMAFESLDLTADVFLVQDTAYCHFQNVKFLGPLTFSDLDSDADATSCIRFESTPALITSQVLFDGCRFGGTTWGINSDQQVQSVVVSNSKFYELYQGVVLGAGTPVLGGPTGVRVTHNFFDQVYAQGIIFGDVSLNATGYNIFYNVGNHFNGTTSPATTIIDIQSNNNVSVGDLFERTDAYATTYARINLNTTTSIGVTNSKQLAIGQYVRETGTVTTLTTDGTVFTINATQIKAFVVNYTMIRNTGYRTGSLTVAGDSGATDLTYSDDYVENLDIGVNLTASQVGSTISVDYASTIIGDNVNLTYSITHLA
jgi:hypothetical protein